jgi:rhamnosyl/mannosyltransferase
MRVLHLGKYWRKDGGIETHVKTLCKSLASNGVDVVNLVSSIDREGNRFEIDGYTVVESPTLGVYFSTSIAPRMMLDARRLHVEEPFDIIHLHFPDPMSHLASMTLPSEIPRIITWHSDIVKQKNLIKLYRPLQLHTIRQSKAIIAATQSNISRSTQIPIQYPINQRKVIPFGFNFEWLLPTPNVLKKIQAIRLQAQGRFMLFALGRHVEYKGFDVLINAISQTQAFLVLGGEGPLTAELKTQVQNLGIEKQVIFTGRMKKEEIASHYHACDVFCLPSISPAEAFGIVQIEAMACGKPVICTQLNNGVNDINLHGITGLTVPSQNSKALSDAINQLAKDKSMCERMGNQAKQHALHNFKAKNMAKEHLTLYQTLLKTCS